MPGEGAIDFDGVFRDAMVILNGHFIGRSLSGYAPFRFDVTDLITYGGKNALVVRVDATEYEGWFYEGAGIYRHVWLEKTAPLHVAQDGVFITTKTNADGSAVVTVQVEVVNEQDVPVTAPLGVEVTAAALETRPPYVRQATPPYVLNLKPWETKRVTLTLTVPRAKLWSPDEPHLYRAAIQLGSHDAIDQTFGIRTLKWDADKGFFLNGVRTELKGTCNHQDHAGVGAALPDALVGCLGRYREALAAELQSLADRELVAHLRRMDAAAARARAWRN